MLWVLFLEDEKKRYLTYDSVECAAEDAKTLQSGAVVNRFKDGKYHPIAIVECDGTILEVKHVKK